MEPEPQVSTETSPVTADSFGWDSWDGSSYDSFPAEAKPWAERVGAFHGARVESATADLNRQRDIYTAYLNGREDPRVAELNGKLDESEKRYRDLEGQHKQSLADHESYKTDSEAKFNAWMDEQISDFAAQNPWIFDNGKVEKLAQDVIAEGFKIKHLPILLKLPQAVQDKARELNKEFVSAGARDMGHRAIEIAQQQVGAPKGRPAARVVSGPASPQSNNGKAKPLAKNATLREQIQESIARRTGRG